MPYTVKIGATLTVTPQIARMILMTEMAFVKVMGHAFQLVITSGNDGVHSLHSLHYENKALDFRTGHSWEPPLMSILEVEAVRDEIKALLGEGFDVVVEKDHVHVEHDQKPVRV